MQRGLGDRQLRRPLARVLNIMLSGLGGVEVLRTLRSQSNIPVLILTARGDDIDRIVFERHPMRQPSLRAFADTARFFGT